MTLQTGRSGLGLHRSRRQILCRLLRSRESRH
jgi:hypothetical protein